MIKKSPVFIRQERALIKVDTDRILWLETAGNYTNMYISLKDRYMVRCTLDKALKILPADEFVKINRAEAVAINHIVGIEGDSIIVSGGDSMPAKGKELVMSRQYKKLVKEKLTIIE